MQNKGAYRSTMAPMNGQSTAVMMKGMPITKLLLLSASCCFEHVSYKKARRNAHACKKKTFMSVSDSGDPEAAQSGADENA